MDEERIARALRQGPPGIEVYVPGRVVDLVASQRPVVRDPARVRSIWRALSDSLQLAAIMVVAVALIGTVLLLRPQMGVEVGATPSPVASPELLVQLRAAGRIRIAVRPDFPQSSVQGSVGGFDIDVANELAERLRLAPELIVLRGAGTDAEGVGRGWDIALPSGAPLHPAAFDFRATEPYYHWPVYVVIPTGAAFRSVADLEGLTLCVVMDSSGEAWLGAGAEPPSATPVVSPPPGVVVRRLATDAACLDDLTAGRSMAMVTATLSNADLTARRIVTALGGPVLTEPRAIVARRYGPDPAGLLAEIEIALAEMRSDRTLSDLARRRFGGTDLSSPPAP